MSMAPATIVLRVLAAAIFAAAPMAAAPIVDAAPPNHPFPQHRVYAPGTIRPDNHPQAAQDRDVAAFYSWWKKRYLLGAGMIDGKPAYRISFGIHQSQQTVSEGQGYGMVIVALMAGQDPGARDVFDGLLAFALAHPSEQDKALMAWKVPTAAGDADSAFDGDADIAYSLILADAQWGSGGRFSYHDHAVRWLDAIQRSTIGTRTGLPLLGDWVRPDSGRTDETTGRPSDFMPAHFASFARYTGDERWRRSTQRTRASASAMQSTLSPKTGLLPDFAIHLDTVPQPAPPDFLETRQDGAYYTNSARVPWRIGTDALINGDPESTEQSRRISAWIERQAGGDPRAIRAGYALDGTPLEDGDYFTSLYAAPFGVAAMTNPAQQAWLNRIYDAVRTHHEDYFEDSVTLMTLLVMTGNYWDPTIP